MCGQYRLGLVSLFLLPLLGLAGCAGAAGSSANSSSSNAAAGSPVLVFPNAISLLPGGVAQFSASVMGSSNYAVSWSINGQGSGNAAVGTISSTGLYLAPTAVSGPTTIAVTATSQANPSNFGSATVTVSAPNNNQKAQAFPIKLGTTGGNVKDLNTSSTGAAFCCSGTLGALVQRGGQQFILSNNHILDRSDQGTIGDPISQPGLADADCNPSSVATVAHLSQAAPLQTSNVDAALAVVVTGAVDPTGTILELGAGAGGDAPPAATPADPATVLATAEPVAKSGRATGLTCSTLESISTSVQVDYLAACGDSTPAFTVTFNNQVIVQGGDFSGAGDSGSLIVTADTAQPVALLYAGTGQSSAGNPLGDVLAALADPNTSEQPTLVGGAPHAVACPASAANQNAAIKLPLSEAESARAAAALPAASGQLLADSSISSVEIGTSDDAPGEAALVIHLKAGMPHSPLPAQIDGVRTKIIQAQAANLAAPTGLSSPTPLSRDELSRSAAVKNKYANALLHQAGVLGVGVGASLDAAGESAVIVYVEKGASVSVPAILDGRRTRLITTDRFRSFGWGHEQRPICAANPAPGSSHSANPFPKEKF